MKTNPCKKCNGRYRILTKEGFCAFCYNEEFGEWPKEFTMEKDKDKEMTIKFRKHGGKKKKKKK